MKYLNLLAMVVFTSVSVLLNVIFGVRSGKNSQKTKQFQEEIGDANETEKRNLKLNLDSDDVVRERLREFTRK